MTPSNFDFYGKSFYSIFIFNIMTFMDNKNKFCCNNSLKPPFMHLLQEIYSINCPPINKGQFNVCSRICSSNSRPSALLCCSLCCDRNAIARCRQTSSFDVSTLIDPLSVKFLKQMVRPSASAGFHEDEGWTVDVPIRQPVINAATCSSLVYSPKENTHTRTVGMLAFCRCLG